MSYPQFRNFDVSTKLIHTHEVVFFFFFISLSVWESLAVYLFGLTAGMNVLLIDLLVCLTGGAVYDNRFSLAALGRYRIFALTNNFTGVCSSDATKTAEGPSQPPPGFSFEKEMKFLGWEQGVAPPSLRSLFDDFCDSSVLGMRQVLSTFNWE